MTFDEVLDQIRELLQQRGRVTYRSLKLRYQLEDELLAGVTDELISAERVAVDEDGKVLVWVANSEGERAKREKGEKDKTVEVVSDQLPVGGSSQPPAPQTPNPELRTSQSPVGERRQLTVMFIDLVGSTTLSQQLDPEDYHARVVAYQEACQQVIARYEGHIAQYLGDGVLAYFGYPAAHEDDAVRAVRSGLEIVAAVRQLDCTPPLQVRIGVHTGPVVVGEIGAGGRTERLALGETPNIAARVQGVAEPNTVLMSAGTRHLVQGLFECQDLGRQILKGLSAPLSLYRVIRESAAQSRFEVAVQAGLTPLVGRDVELGLLQERWAQAQGGEGQVVLLSGEAGIGKSRLVQTLKEQVMAEGAVRIELHCSPYHQHSAFYPLIEHLQRLLQFQREDSPHVKLGKLQQRLARYRFPQADTLPLLAALLSLPHPNDTPPLTFSPQKQKQKTQEVLVAWIMEEAEQATVYCAWEDLHWADPSTLEVLTLLLDQVPTIRLLVLLTFRPDFRPPWRPRSHLTQLTLNRLGRPQVEAMMKRVTGGKALPPEVVQQIVHKTDGVPLFVEELTKMMMESGLLKKIDGHYELSGPLPPLAIPTTLQDSLMARLDRLAPVREVAQLGATLGREFSYDLIQAISPLDEATLQEGLRQLVEAELVYQKGLPPQATYLFKHALIQDAAYQSLLKHKRQHYHQQIAQVVAARLPETIETQPELLAYHYTEAGLKEQAIPYWQKAGQRALQRSANTEAITHLSNGLELLKTLPDSPERAQQELQLQVTVGPAWMALKGYSAPEVERAYTRALELCRHIGDTPQLFPVLSGLSRLYYTRAELPTARDLGEQCLRLSQTAQDPVLLLEAHRLLGATLFYLGDLVLARTHLEQSIALYDPQQYHPLALIYGTDPQVASLCYLSNLLWCLGYPEQALQKSHASLTVAKERAHLISLAGAWHFSAVVQQFRREGQAAQERAEAAIALCNEQGFTFFSAMGTIDRGGAYVEQGRGEEGIAQIRQGLVVYQGTGAALFQPYWLALLAEAYRKVGQVEEGRRVLTEALAAVEKTGERMWEAELYRLKGELSLQQFKVQGSRFKVEESPKSGGRSPKSPNPKSQILDPQSEAESCFLKAIEIAGKQEAKSLELRAVMSLVRLRQQQDLRQEAESAEQGARSKELGVRSKGQETRTSLVEAHRRLSEVYNWFTEGFDTADLKDAQALLELS